MEPLQSVIETIISFPEVYLGNRSLQRLYAFIGCYLHGREEANDHCLDGFNEYVYAKFHLWTDHNWASIINFFYPDERAAFDKFTELFHEYIKEQKHLE